MLRRHSNEDLAMHGISAAFSASTHAATSLKPAPAVSPARTDGDGDKPGPEQSAAPPTSSKGLNIKA
jgi:hypothetical protein